jgi:hypothetical protein
MELADRLAEATGNFLAGLDAEVGATVIQPFDDRTRREWAYWPAPRLGIPLWALTRSQVKAAQRLLATMLRLPAYARAVTIMNLDEVLDVLEGYRSTRRHGHDYSVAVFGRPGKDPWGVRFEGHHVSVHATVTGGEVRLTPLFLGANPAVVYDGGHMVVAPLAPEEQLGFELLHALSAEQLQVAVISDRAPTDIVSRNQSRLDGGSAVGGVAVAGLHAAAAGIARQLLQLYLRRVPDGAFLPGDRDIRFSWAGASEPGCGHYYRLAGPRLLIEFDNTQNDANHIHTVWRDLENDFGGDVLKRHYEQSHK